MLQYFLVGNWYVCNLSYLLFRLKKDYHLEILLQKIRYAWYILRNLYIYCQPDFIVIWLKHFYVFNQLIRKWEVYNRGKSYQKGEKEKDECGGGSLMWEKRRLFEWFDRKHFRLKFGKREAP